MRYGFRSVRRSDKEALLLKVILTNLCFDLQQFHKTIKTLCFLNFTFNFLSQKSSDDSFQPSLPKIANLRQKIGDFYFFTITYSLFTKSSRRFLESNK